MALALLALSAPGVGSAATPSRALAGARETPVATAAGLPGESFAALGGSGTAPFLRAPAPKPLAAGVAIRETAAAAPVTAVESPSRPDPAIASSFEAQPDSGWSPPDTHGAVGPAHLLVVVNGAVRVQTRTGTVLFNTTLQSFFDRPGFPVVDVFDPKAIYDPYGARFVVTAMAERRSAASGMVLAVSASSDALGTWYFFKYDADAADQGWADYPSIGFNKNWIVVSYNLFASATDAFITSIVYAIDKQYAYAGAIGPATRFQDSTGSLGFTIAPAETLDPGLETLYLLNDSGQSAAGTSLLRLHSIVKTGAGPVLLPGGLFGKQGVFWGGGTGADYAPQKGSSMKIQANDSRMHQVVYRNGSLWAVHTAFLTLPTRAAAQWWEIAPAGAVLQHGRVEDTSAAPLNTSYTFPSISVNAAGDVLVGYSQFNFEAYASAGFSFRYATDPPNTMRPGRLLKAGLGPYERNAPRNRWGDYSHTVVDPLNDTDFWTIQEYAETPWGSGLGSGQWGTWWARIVPAP